MTSRQGVARFLAGRAARIILGGSTPETPSENPAAQVSDIIVSNLVVREDASNGLVGYLYAIGTTAPVTFSITSDPDGIFAIVNGNELHKADAFGTGADYAITIKATETVGGAEYSEEFTVDVIPAETVVPDPPVGDGGGSGDVVVPDEEDPDSDTDPYVQPPVEIVTEIASTVSGKNGGTSVFLKDWGVPEAGGVYVLKYSADWSGMSAQGRYAAVGFGFKQGQNFHMVGLRGNGAVMTTMLASRLYGDFRKAKQFSITNDGAAANGTRSGPNWLRLTIGEDATTYTLESSADGEEWDLEIEDAAPSPFTDATDATQFGPAAYFYEEDKGAFVITISEFQEVSFVGAVDDLSTAPSGAWSVYRRLVADYTGPLIRVRRTSDNTELNVGYDDDNILDTAALLAFVGAGDAYIKTIYDQSGNSYDLTETRSANQPFIVQTGALFTGINSKPGISADGTDDMMQSTTDADTIVPVGANTMFAIARPTLGSDKTLDTIYEGRAIAGGNPDGVWAFAMVDQQGGTDQALFYSYDGTQTGAGVDAPELPYTAVFAMVKTASAVKGYINGGAGASAPRGTRPTAAGNKFTLFKHWSSSQHWGGQFMEIITFASEPSLADKNALGADMAAVAGTTWTPIT
jgi:hypothetical protein